jgi:hypothetical protein
MLCSSRCNGRPLVTQMACVSKTKLMLPPFMLFLPTDSSPPALELARHSNVSTLILLRNTVAYQAKIAISVNLSYVTILQFNLAIIQMIYAHLAPSILPALEAAKVLRVLTREFFVSCAASSSGVCELVSSVTFPLSVGFTSALCNTCMDVTRGHNRAGTC